MEAVLGTGTLVGSGYTHDILQLRRCAGIWRRRTMPNSYYAEGLELRAQELTDDVLIRHRRQRRAPLLERIVRFMVAIMSDLVIYTHIMAQPFIRTQRSARNIIAKYLQKFATVLLSTARHIEAKESIQPSPH